MNMTPSSKAILETGRKRAEIKEQNEKHEKFVGRFFLFPPSSFAKLNGGSAER